MDMYKKTDFTPNRRQAIIYTNADLLSFGYPEINFSEIEIIKVTFSLKKEEENALQIVVCWESDILSRPKYQLRHST